MTRNGDELGGPDAGDADSDLAAAESESDSEGLLLSVAAGFAADSLLFFA